MAKSSFFRNCFLLVTTAQNSAYFTKGLYGDIIISSTGKHNIFPKKFLGGFIMNKVIEFLKENPVQYLATVGRDGKAKCRPFMFAGEMDGKLWFCTNNTKDVYLDMQSNPIVKGQYETADNPIFEVFYLDEPHGVIADFSGNPPYTF